MVCHQNCIGICIRHLCDTVSNLYVLKSTCIPLAVECYGAWGPEALKAFSQVATRLAIRGNTSKSMALADLFGRLSHSLIRANARAILSRSYSHLVQQLDELCV